MTKQSVLNKIDYILAAVIILNCNTVFAKGVDFNFHLEWLGCCICIIAILVYGFLNKFTLHILYKWFSIMCCYLPVMIIYLIVMHKPVSTIMFIRLFIIFFPCILLYILLAAKIQTGTNLYKAIADIMFVVGALSSILWFLANVIGVLHQTGDINVNWGGERVYKSFYGVYYQIAWQSIKIFGLSGYRNIGFFCEAPMLSLMLIFTLIYELFFRQANIGQKKYSILIGRCKIRTVNLHWIRVAILVIANVTTFSATGYILMIVVFVLKYLQSDAESNFIVIRLLSIPVIVGIAAFAIYSVWNQKASSAQWLTRFDDFFVGMAAWNTNKLFGIGVGNFDGLTLYQSAFRSSNIGMSTGLFSVLAQGGILLSLFYAIPLVGGIIGAKRHQNKGMLVLMIIALLECVFTYFPYTHFMLLLLAYGILNISENALNNMIMKRGK